jgi:hypothetical protein
MLTPSTELDAVNQMLGMIGELPVDTIEDSGVSEAGIALTTLRSHSKAVQYRGLHCNTEENFPLPLNSDGTITVPTNATVLSCTDGSLDVTQRGTKLYDRYAHSYTFVNTVYVDIVMLLDFEDLPEDARLYIALRAGRDFIKDQIGSDTLVKLSQECEMEALAILRSNEEIRMGNNFIYSSRSPNNGILLRGSVQGRG